MGTSRKFPLIFTSAFQNKLFPCPHCTTDATQSQPIRRYWMFLMQQLLLVSVHWS